MDGWEHGTSRRVMMVRERRRGEGEARFKAHKAIRICHTYALPSPHNTSLTLNETSFNLATATAPAPTMCKARHLILKTRARLPARPQDATPDRRK